MLIAASCAACLQRMCLQHHSFVVLEDPGGWLRPVWKGRWAICLLDICVLPLCMQLLWQPAALSSVGFVVITKCAATHTTSNCTQPWHTTQPWHLTRHRSKFTAFTRRTVEFDTPDTPAQTPQMLAQHPDAATTAHEQKDCVVWVGVSGTHRR